MLGNIPILTSDNPCTGTDNAIKLSNNNFNQGITITNEFNMNEPTSFFPSDETLSKFASAVYDDNPKDAVQGWSLLTTATNVSDGYFGAAFWNCKFQQLVVANRGTLPSSIKSTFADIEGIVRNQYTAQMSSASCFALHVLKELPDVDKIQVSMTGHSLGAWLAQTTAFTLHHLTIEDDKFRLIKETERSFHAHIVGFESPGCEPMLTRLAHRYYYRYDPTTNQQLTKLDITTYLTLPNRINCLNKHIGNLKLITIKEMEKGKLGFLKTYFTYNSHYHSIENIVEAMQSSNDNGDDDENRTENKIGTTFKIRDWPCWQWPQRAVSNSTLPRGFMEKLFKCLDIVPVILDSVTGTANSNELKSYYKESENNSLGFNGFTPPADNSSTHLSKGHKLSESDLHFKVENFNDTERNFNIFTETELTFLLTLAELKNQNLIIPEIICKTQNVNFNNFMQVLPDFSLNKKQQIIKSKSTDDLMKVVNLIKHLFRCLPDCEIIKLNKTIVDQLPSSFLRCQQKSMKYIETFDKNLKFRDTIGLQAFLESDEKILKLISNEQCILELTRIYNILMRLGIQNHIFLKWDQFVRLNDIILLDETFQAKGEYLLVLNCQRMSKQIIKKERKLMQKLIQLDNKLILVFNPESGCLNCVQEYGETKNIEFKYANLLPESQTWLSEKMIRFNDTDYTLNDLIDDERKGELSLKTVEILSKSESKVEIETFNLKRAKLKDFCIQVNEDVDLNNFFNRLNEDENVFIMISSSNINANLFEEFLEIFDKNKQIKLREFISDGKVTLCHKSEENRILDKFNELCSAHAKYKIFWLELVYPRLFLRQIYDSLLYIPTALIQNRNTECIDEETQLNNNSASMFQELLNSERFVIICNERGMGKSTSLFRFKEDLENAESKWVVIHLDLVSHQLELQHLSIKNVDDVVQLMVKTIDSTEPKDLLTQILFCAVKNSNLPENSNLNKIVFLFDGFDELKEEGRQKMLSILQILRNESTVKICITTSPDQKQDLEECLFSRQCSSRKFQKCNRQKQCEFLIKFWACCLHFHTFDNDSLKKFAFKQLDLVKEIFGVENPEFLEKPKDIRMLAEMMWPLLKKGINSLNNSFQQIKALNKKQLIDQFVNYKYKIYMKRQNLQGNDYLVKRSLEITLGEQFRNLSVQTIFPELKTIFLPDHQPDDKLLSGMTRVGLTKMINQEYHFIYRILGEYFAAEFLSRYMKKNCQCQPLSNDYIRNKVLNESKYKGICKFIEYAIQELEK